MLKKLKNRKGFTLIELIVVIAIVIILIFFVGGVLLYGTIYEGNFYFKKGGVLKALQYENPNVTEILKVKTNIWDYTEITVQEGDTTKVYCLDTNMLFNYEFRECED